MKSLLFILIITILGSKFKESKSQIWNGKDLNQRRFNYHVSIFRDNKYRCAGSIVDEKHVITASHCVTNSSEERFKIVAGVKNLHYDLAEIKLVENIFEETREYSENERYDIALLVLETPFVLGENIGSIKLPTAPTSANSVLICSIVGLEHKGLRRIDLEPGHDEMKLSKTNLVLISPIVAECILQRKVLHSSLLYAVAVVETDLTPGDSGSVLVCDGVAVGIQSGTEPFTNGSRSEVHNFMPIYASIEFIRRRGRIINPWHDQIVYA